MRTGVIDVYIWDHSGFDGLMHASELYMLLNLKCNI